MRGEEILCPGTGIFCRRAQGEVPGNEARKASLPGNEATFHAVMLLLRSMDKNECLVFSTQGFPEYSRVSRALRIQFQAAHYKSSS